MSEKNFFYKVVVWFHAKTNSIFRIRFQIELNSINVMYIVDFDMTKKSEHKLLGFVEY